MIHELNSIRPEDEVTASSTKSPARRVIWAMAIAVAALVTLASGWLQGRMSQRWGNDERLQLVGERLNRFPDQIGPWRQDATYELSADALELLKCKGYIHRGYRNEETGDYLKLAVMVGPGSKMSIHVPEICYEASNFTLLAPRERLVIDATGREHAFWGVTFQMNDVTERKVSVVYGWSAGQQWLAPLFPRWSVAGYPVLCKLQLSFVGNDPTIRDQAASDEVLSRFLTDAVAVLDELIQGSPSEPAARPRSE